jgi:hypothetical protein
MELALYSMAQVDLVDGQPSSFRSCPLGRAPYATLRNRGGGSEAIDKLLDDRAHRAIRQLGSDLKLLKGNSVEVDGGHVAPSDG